MEHRAQLALLQEAMDSQRHADEVMSANENLRLSIALRQSTLDDLQKVSLAAATLLSSVDSSSPQTEPSSLRILTNLPQSGVLDPAKDENSGDPFKGLIGKYLSQLLSLIKTSTCTKGGPNLLSMIDLELTLQKKFVFAEERNLIPKTDEKGGWKKASASRKKLYETILQARRGAADPDAEEEDE